MKDTGTPVILSYDVPFKFTGTIHKATIDLKCLCPIKHGRGPET